MKLTLSPAETKILPRRAVLASQPYDAPSEGRLNAIRLDFNETTSPVAPCYPEGMPPSMVSTYPEYGQLIDKLAAYYKLDAKNFTVTNGSDEAISLIANTFIESGEDAAVISTPCFIMIKQCLRLAGARLDEVSVNADLSFNLETIEERLNESPKLAMFATPDNPTGSVIPVDVIEKWCAAYPKILFVIDEAYGEFAGTSVIPLISKYENLLVLKTFSKAWGMAGFRLGMVVGNSELIEYIGRIKLPYSVNSAAVFTALNLLDRESDMVARVESTLTQRARLKSSLEQRGYRVKETSANWCLVGAGMLAKDLTAFSAKSNVLIRNRSTSEFSRYGIDVSGVESGFEPMWGLIRVSAGNADELTTFENVLDAYRKNYALIFDLDGTVVDTSKSFDETVAFLVEKFSGKALDINDLLNLRLEGGFNDDWIATQELLKRRGGEVSLKEIATEGERYYLSIARDKEELLVTETLLKNLRKRQPLYIVTGRSRREYEPVWGERLNKLFDGVYCVDDVPGLRAKPSPDYLLQVLKDSGIAGGAYIGNAVDDMQAARAAGMTAIGVACGDTKATFIEAGAQAIISTCAEMAALMMVDA